MATSSLYCAENSELESAGSSYDEEVYSDQENQPEQREESEENSSSGKLCSLASAHVHCIILAIEESDSDDDDDSSDSSSESSSGEDSDDQLDDFEWEEQSTPVGYKRRRQIMEGILQQSLRSGMYPTFYGTHGATQSIDPRQNNALVYLQKVWTLELVELIADQTNIYMLKRQATSKKARKMPASVTAATTAKEMWVFLGLALAMGFHVLPRYCNYWSRDEYLGVRALSECMSRDRFNYLRRHLHLVDDDTIAQKDRHTHYKVQPLVDHLQTAFLRNYCPNQEIVVDEFMIKCKGRARGIVVMPKKPVKRGFKMWSLSCSCCGYLCNFNIYAGKLTKKRDMGLAKKAVLALTEPFEGINHVIYLDNYFTSLDLIVELRQKHIYSVGTTRCDSKGLPACLKGKKLPIEKGAYKCVTVGRGESEVNCFAYHDRKMVRFMTNAFPPSMATKGAVRGASGLLFKREIPPLVPAYNKFMGGVDRTGQLRQYYGNDHRCMRPWVCIFFHLFDLAINNAFLLYKHNSNHCSLRPKDLLAFRLELVHCLLDSARKPHKRPSLPQPCPDPDVANNPCRLVKVEHVSLGQGKFLKRGKCHYCLQKKRKPVGYTVFACSHCRVRLCKTGCYDEYHKL